MSEADVFCLSFIVSLYVFIGIGVFILRWDAAIHHDHPRHPAVILVVALLDGTLWPLLIVLLFGCRLWDDAKEVQERRKRL